jgi:transposase
MDLKGSIPTFVRITSGVVHEATIFPTIPLEASAIYVMDKGYTDLETLYSFSKSNCFFIIGAKRNTVYYRRCSHPIDKSAGIRSDQTIQLTGPKTSRLYPISLRRITFRDEEQHRTFVFLTNYFQLDALTICQLYKLRWQIELFFKWIKQHLRIKSFFGTSINAVKTQIWIAISVYVLVAIIKKELKLERSLHEILQIISILLFEKTPLKQALTENSYDFKEQQNYNQLSLFNL